MHIALPRFRRFGAASLFVMIAAVTIAITVRMERSKSEITAYVQVCRPAMPYGQSPRRLPEGSDAEFDSFRRTQVEVLRSESVLTLAVRDPSISRHTFLRRMHDPVEWLKTNLKIDYPNDAELMRVRLFTSQPEDGATIVNAVVRAYLKEVGESDANERRETAALPHPPTR